MKSTYKILAKTGVFLAALAVIVGAYGAHAIRDVVEEKDMQVFETAVKYQFYHALAIILFSLSYRRLNQKFLVFSLILMILGILIFSGSLYMLATVSLWGNDSYRVLGAVTPVGGLSLIMGWMLIFFKGFSDDEYEFEQQANDLKREHRHRHHGHRHHHSRHHSTEQEHNSTDDSTHQ